MPVGEALLTWVRKAVSGLQNVSVCPMKTMLFLVIPILLLQGRPRCLPHSKLTTAVLEGLA